LVCLQQQEQANHVLLVTVLNMLYPVGIEVLHRIFSKYGTILKIVIFQKSAGFQALIQFSDVASASAARTELDGQNIYSNCCTLRIQFSTLQNLTVKYNNEKSRDFTNLSLPPGPSDQQTVPQPVAYTDPTTGLYATPELATAIAAQAGAYNQYQSLYSGMQAMQGMPSVPGMPLGYTTGIPAVPASTNSPVVIVSGLEPSRITCDALFTLFGVYGDVQRVKILFNKQDTALIQFTDGMQAQTAISNLNGVPLHNNILRVNFSKHNYIQLPKPEQEQGAELTKDYAGSPLHRYKQPGSKNFQHICPPATVLHISNIPDLVQEEELRQLFATYGTVVGFKFLTTAKRMALLQMSTLQEAIEALIGCHNYPIAQGMNLRVSFSKNTI